MTKSKLVFPVGYHKFHKKQVFNFQLNRWYSLGYARFEDMKTINDFRLLQLSWVFDLNFPASFAMASRRGDLETIGRSLPDEPEVNHAVSFVMDHLDRSGGTG